MFNNFKVESLSSSEFGAKYNSDLYNCLQNTKVLYPSNGNTAKAINLFETLLDSNDTDNKRIFYRGSTYGLQFNYDSFLGTYKNQNNPTSPYLLQSVKCKFQVILEAYRNPDLTSILTPLEVQDIYDITTSIPSSSILPYPNNTLMFRSNDATKDFYMLYLDEFTLTSKEPNYSRSTFLDFSVNPLVYRYGDHSDNNITNPIQGNIWAFLFCYRTIVKDNGNSSQFVSTTPNLCISTSQYYKIK